MSGLRKLALTVLIGLIHFITVGHVFTFGFLIDPFMKTFTIENGTTIVNSTELSLTFVSSIGTVQLGMFMGLQFLTVCAFNYSQKLPKSKMAEIYVLFGIICWVSGTFFTTLTTNGDQLFGVYSTFTGLGSSLIYWTTLAMVSEIDSGGLALAVVVVCGGLGQLVFSLVVAPHYTLEYVQGFGGMQQSWKVALQYLAIIGGVLYLLCFALILLIRWDVCCMVQRNEKKYVPLATNDVSLRGSRKSQMSSADLETKSFWSANFSLRSGYWLLVVSTLTSGFAMYAPYVQLIEYLLSLDTPLTTSETTIVLMDIAICSIVGRLLLLIPSMLDTYFKNMRMLWPGVFLFVNVHNAIVIGSWQAVTSYTGALVFASFFGLGFGIQLGTTLLLTRQFSAIVDNNSKGFRSTFALNLVPVSIAMAISAVGAGTIFGAIFDSCEVSGRGYLCAINTVMAFQLFAVLSSIGVFVGMWRFYS